MKFYRKNVKPRYALFDDVVAEIKHPYRLQSLVGISKQTIANAKQNGYFGENASIRIAECTYNRVQRYQMPTIKQKLGDV